MFECERSKFIALKNISNAPGLEALQKFYVENLWRINSQYDVKAFNCYERLYYFWSYYKPKENYSWIALLVFVPLLFGKK